MKDHNPNNKAKQKEKKEDVYKNLPVYNSQIWNESGVNYSSEEIKSHSFSVRHPEFLAGENIIFEPGESPAEK